MRDAQIAHAVGDSLEERHPPGTYVVVLACRDEAHLLAETDRLEAKGVALVRVIENEGPYAGQLTAVGLKPARKESVRRLLSSIASLRP